MIIFHAIEEQNGVLELDIGLRITTRWASGDKLANDM